MINYLSWSYFYSIVFFIGIADKKIVIYLANKKIVILSC